MLAQARLICFHARLHSSLQVLCPPSPVLNVTASGWFSPSALPPSAPILSAVSNGSLLTIQPRGTFGFPVSQPSGRWVSRAVRTSMAAVQAVLLDASASYDGFDSVGPSRGHFGLLRFVWNLTAVPPNSRLQVGGGNLVHPTATTLSLLQWGLASWGGDAGLQGSVTSTSGTAGTSYFTSAQKATLVTVRWEAPRRMWIWCASHPAYLRDRRLLQQARLVASRDGSRLTLPQIGRRLRHTRCSCRTSLGRTASA